MSRLARSPKAIRRASRTPAWFCRVIRRFGRRRQTSWISADTFCSTGVTLEPVCGQRIDHLENHFADAAEFGFAGAARCAPDESRRTPEEVTAGFSGSKGNACLLQVRVARSSARSASRPFTPFERRSTSAVWQSVPPETMSSPPATSVSLRRSPAPHRP